jgi:glycosyltransferase involved in cell wall biosynthesis
MHVLVLTPYPHGTVAGPRSSFELWESILREADIHLHYAVFETERLHEVVQQPGRTVRKGVEMLRAYGKFVYGLRDLDGYDALLINREATLIGPAIVERWVSRRGKRLIYWLDDPLYIPYRSPTNGLFAYLKFFGKVKTLSRISTTVMANSPHHVAFLRQYNDNVWEIPSVVDGDRYSGWEPSASANGRVCVGWSGSPTTVGNLQVIRGPLRDFSAREDVELLFIGATDFGLPDIRHDGKAWQADSEIADLRRLDVGLVPLPLTPWTRTKFYLKLIQYMALGIPPVATPLGSNPTVIEHGKTGFLAADDAEWRQYVERLVVDGELREQIGRAASEEAHARYTLQANAERIIAAFRSALR